MFDRQVVELWHPDSPGMRVVVTRGLLARLFLSKHFATLGECIAASKRDTYENSSIVDRMDNKYFRQGFLAACAMLYGQRIPAAVVRNKLVVPHRGSFLRRYSLYHNDGAMAALRVYTGLGLDSTLIDSAHTAAQRREYTDHVLDKILESVNEA